MNNIDPAILKEIDKITSAHCDHCPCLSEEVDLTIKMLSENTVKDIKTNPLLRESVSASLDVLMQNEDNAKEVVAGKHKGELCQLQSQYALGLWEDFEKKYNIENPEVRILVGKIITLALRSYKMSGAELLTKSYDMAGNVELELHPFVQADRSYIDTISKALQTLNDLEFGRKITIKTELPDRKELFGSGRWILLNEDDVKEDEKSKA